MSVFFNSWESIFRVILTVLFAYPGLIVLLRLSGKRSLAKLNMFDFIITVALGSTFASVVISQNVTIFDGLVTFAMLLTAQFIITRTSIHSRTFDKLIKSEPTMVFHDGHYLREAMDTVRVTEDEILAEVRQNGYACLNDVYAVVLETNGMLSVLGRTDNIQISTLSTVSNYPSAG